MNDVKLTRKAVVLMGLPLAGKTTWVNTQEFGSTYHVSADSIKEGHPDYDPDAAHLLHEWSVKEAEIQIETLSDCGHNIVFDSGSINNSYTVRILTMLKSKGYTIELVHIKTPYKVCLERNKLRKRKVPEKDIITKAIKENKQFYRLKAIVDTYKVIEYFTHKHIFIDMDGVVAALSTLPVVGGEIDFVNGEVHKHLDPVEPVVRKLLNLNEYSKSKHTLYILSATPNSFSMKEKNDWLDTHFPIDPTRRFFVNQGKHKAEMLENLQNYLKLKKKDITLIDDTHSILYDVEARGMRPMHPSEFLTYKFK